MKKDNVLEQLIQKTYYSWKRFVLDSQYSYPIEEKSTSIPTWIFYSPQLLSMTYSHMYQRVQEENLSVLYKYHDRYFFHENVKIKIGVLWYNHVLWFLAQNEQNGEIYLIW